MRPKSTRKARIGRPPAGIRAGEMVKDYPQLNLRVPPETRAKLDALSTVRKQPRWRIVLDAIDHYFSLQGGATLDEP
jgi:hypothetical protein